MNRVLILSIFLVVLGGCGKDSGNGSRLGSPANQNREDQELIEYSRIEDQESVEVAKLIQVIAEGVPIKDSKEKVIRGLSKFYTIECNQICNFKRKISK
jgi:hypothetical protein